MERPAARTNARAALRPWHVHRRRGLRLRLAEGAGMIVMGLAVLVLSVAGRPVAARRAEDEERVGARGGCGRRRKADRHHEAVEKQEGSSERGKRPALATKQSESSPAYGHGRINTRTRKSG
jgi:hypothetical protein